MLYLAADAHVVKKVWKHREVLAGDAYRAWRAMCDAVIKDDATDKVLILAGDTLDFRLCDGSTIQALEEGIADLFEAGVGIMFTQGNHDHQEVNHLEALGCIPLHGVEKKVQGLTIRGLDYMPREQLVPVLDKLPACDLLVMHGAGQHLLGFEGAYDYTLDDVPVSAKNVLVGDIHVTDVTETSRGTRVISPGSLHPLNISEGGDHGFFKMEPKTGELTFVKIPTRDIHRVNAWDEDEFETSVRPLLESLKETTPEYRPIIQVQYDPTLVGLVTGTCRTYVDKAVFMYDEQIRLDGVSAIGDRPVYKQAGMLDALDELPVIKGEETAMGLLRGMLRAEDPEDYLTNYTKEVLHEVD